MANNETPQQRSKRIEAELRKRGKEFTPGEEVRRQQAQREEKRKRIASQDIPNQVGKNIPNQVGVHIPNQIPMEGMGGYGGYGDRRRKQYIEEQEK